MTYLTSALKKEPQHRLLDVNSFAAVGKLTLNGSTDQKVIWSVFLLTANVTVQLKATVSPANGCYSQISNVGICKSIYNTESQPGSAIMISTTNPKNYKNIAGGARTEVNLQWSSLKIPPFGNVRRLGSFFFFYAFVSLH